jgi:CDP-diacylglycerol--glycerol-3-phosphate 3-phosphatidyltransferase
MRASPTADAAVAGPGRRTRPIYGVYWADMDGDEHVRDWAALHRTEAPGGFVGGWLKAAAAVARPLARAGVSPNMVTVAALVAALVAVALAAVDGWIGPAAACVAVTVSGLLDSLDGAVAVQAGRTTKVGFLLDSVLDRLADVAFPVALAIVAGGGAAVTRLAVAAVATCWWLEYVRARGSLAGADAAGPPVVTPGERPTRIILTAVGLGLPFLATAALWASVVIVGGSGLFLFGWSIRRLRAQDAAGPPAPTAGW